MTRYLKEKGRLHRVLVVAGAFADLTEFQRLVESNRAYVGFTHFKEDFNNVLAFKGFKQRFNKHAPNALASALRDDRQVQNFALVRDFAAGYNACYFFTLPGDQEAGTIVFERISQSQIGPCRGARCGLKYCLNRGEVLFTARRYRQSLREAPRFSAH